MQYKIELKVRNHNTLSRQLLIDTAVSCVPSGWTVNLEDAEVFFLVEVFKVRSLLLMECIHEKEHLLINCFGQSVCGIGIVKDYYARQKFNVMEIANMKNAEAELGGEEGRVTTAHEREVRH
jgi:tRNA acetyltransferase TAN1